MIRLHLVLHYKELIPLLFLNNLKIHIEKFYTSGLLDHFKCEKDNHYGVIVSGDKVVVPFNYDDILYEKVFNCEVADNWEFYDLNGFPLGEENIIINREVVTLYHIELGLPISNKIPFTPSPKKLELAKV